MRQRDRNLIAGSGLVTASAIFYATYGVWSKLMVGTFGEFNQAAIKAIILLGILGPAGWLMGWYKRIVRTDWKWFAAIAIAGGLNQAPYYFGFEHLSVGTATLLFYTALTLGAYGLGIVFFGEKLTPVKAAAFGMAMVGLAVIYRLQLGPGQIMAAAATVAAGVMGAVGVVLSKKLSGTYSEIQIISGYLVAMIIVNPVLSLLVGESWPAVTISIAWLAQLGYAVSYVIANVTVVAGYKRLDPSVGALVGLLEVIFGAIYGVVLFGEAITPQLIAGGGLILGAIALPEAARLTGGRWKA